MIDTGIYFGNIHSFEDLDLILSSAVIPPATPKTSYVDIPGADGSVDMSEAHGEVKYSDRTGAKFTFYMNPAGDLSEEAFEEKKKEVSNLLNGLKCKIILDKDPDYYWDGRCTVSEHTADKRLRKFVVGARLSPYKWKIKETRVSFDLSTVSQEITLTNSRKTVCPTVIVSGNATLIFSGYESALSAGTHKILDLQLREGKTAVTVSGTGTITFVYREGDL